MGCKYYRSHEGGWGIDGDSIAYYYEMGVAIPWGKFRIPIGTPLD